MPPRGGQSSRRHSTPLRTPETLAPAPPVQSLVALTNPASTAQLFLQTCPPTPQPSGRSHPAPAARPNPQSLPSPAARRAIAVALRTNDSLSDLGNAWFAPCQQRDLNRDAKRTGS